MTPKVELKRTQRYTFTSQINYYAYDLYIRLPNSYDQREAGEKYDAIYILNGQWDFGLMLSVYGSAYFDGLAPDLILIGIGWNGQESDDEAVKYGMRDFSTFVSNEDSTGGANIFLQVLEKEIIPFVENSFSANGVRGISGGSIAAWFALFAMFHNPALFNKYILSSPPTFFANRLIFEYESSYAKTHTHLNAFLYVSYGALEESLSLKEFINVLKCRAYTDLKIIEEEIKNVGHAANKPIGFTIGLLEVYRKNKIKLSESELLRYAGVYDLGGVFVTIKSKEDYLELFLDANGDGLVLFAENETSFYTEGLVSRLTFKTSNDDQILLTLKLRDKTFSALKRNEL